MTWGHGHQAPQTASRPTPDCFCMGVGDRLARRRRTHRGRTVGQRRTPTGLRRLPASSLCDLFLLKGLLFEIQHGLDGHLPAKGK